jgi:hypothetical protein
MLLREQLAEKERFEVNLLQAADKFYKDVEKKKFEEDVKKRTAERERLEAEKEAEREAERVAERLMERLGEEAQAAEKQRLEEAAAQVIY